MLIINTAERKKIGVFGGHSAISETTNSSAVAEKIRSCTKKLLSIFVVVTLTPAASDVWASA